MEVVLSLVIGVLTAAGVWLVLRPRTFQVLVGLSLLSYAVNLFIFSVGSLAIDRFLRPVCYQDLPASLLPADVRDGATGPKLVDGTPA